MKQIRVLHVVGSSKFGGASSIILALAEMARREGWTVDILATDPEFQRETLAAGFGVVPFRGIERAVRPCRDLGAVWRLWRYLRAHPYTVVHTHTSKGGFIGRLAATLAGVPVVIHTAHGFAIHEESPFWEKAAYVALERLASSWCDAVVACSEFHGKWGAELGMAPRRKLRAVPNGISRPMPTFPREQVRRSLGIGEDEFAVFCPSRIAASKGIDDLLRAAAILKPRMNGRFHVYIAGEGPVEETCKRLAAGLDVNDVVTFLGFRTDVPNLLEAADAVALPSFREGLSISLLEAMSASKPIVAVDIGSNREVGGSILVPAKNPAALANAIEFLFHDRDASDRLAANAGRRFREHYTEDAMIRNYRRVYVELLAAKDLIEVSSAEEISFAMLSGKRARSVR